MVQYVLILLHCYLVSSLAAFMFIHSHQLSPSWSWACCLLLAKCRGKATHGCTSYFLLSAVLSASMSQNRSPKGCSRFSLSFSTVLTSPPLTLRWASPPLRLVSGSPLMLCSDRQSQRPATAHDGSAASGSGPTCEWPTDTRQSVLCAFSKG